MGEASSGNDIAGLERAQSPAHIDGVPNNLFGSGRRDLFNVDAALFRDHHDRGLCLAVENNAEIVFCLDIQLGDNQDFFYF